MTVAERWPAGDIDPDLAEYDDISWATDVDDGAPRVRAVTDDLEALRLCLSEQARLLADTADFPNKTLIASYVRFALIMIDGLFETAKPSPPADRDP